MPDTLTTKLAGLFGSNHPIGEPIRFEWRTITRRGRPWLLLPHSFRAARNGIQLYPAQRPAARLAARLIPLVIGSALGRVMRNIQIATNRSSKLVEFLSQQIGLRPAQLPSPAILFGNQPDENQRFVVLGFDQQFHPRVVIKCGLSSAARRIIDGEAEVLEQLPAGAVGALKPLGRLQTKTLSAFSTAYQPGCHLRGKEGIDQILNAWIIAGPSVSLETLPAWARLKTQCAGNPNLEQITNAISKHSVRPVIFHGDFAPWNIRVNAEGRWIVLDWERAELRGVPGWDWFHFEIQTAILKQRLAAESVAKRVEVLIGSDRFQAYANKAGIKNIVKPLLLAYLLNQTQVIVPREGLQSCVKLHALLSSHWRIS